MRLASGYLELLESGMVLTCRLLGMSKHKGLGTASPKRLYQRSGEALLHVESSKHKETNARRSAVIFLCSDNLYSDFHIGYRDL